METKKSNIQETNSNRQTKSYSTTTPIIIAIVVCLFIFFVGIASTIWYANNYFHVDSSNNRPALFGDSFGAVNALISAFAFAGVIVSMYFQRKDLELQRESIDVQKDELKQNTKELELQRKEFEEQNKTLRLQRFETTFFNMLSLQQEIVNNLRHSYIKREGKFSDFMRGEGHTENLVAIGREVFGHLFEHGIRQQVTSRGYLASQTFETSIFDHYFRHLYRIIKFIDETHLLETKNERYSYISILRASLSKYELIFLFFNGLHHAKFKSLIEKYSLFNNLKVDSLPKSESESNNVDPKSLYCETAFNPDIFYYNRNMKKGTN